MYRHIFYTNVLRLLEERKMTKQDLADQAEISVSFISDMTTGKGNPSLATMQKVAEALEVPLPLLLEVTDMDRMTLQELYGVVASKRFLPPGYEWVTAVLPEMQAYQVRKWHEAARKRLRR